MSSSGVSAINSGPLIIRTYNDNSVNNTYVLGKYDIPISSNRVLITSTNGLVTPSDNINISSINISSINGVPYNPDDDAFWSGSIIGNISNDNSGNVGIGTTNPEFPLDVNGVLRVGNQTGNTSSFEINLGTNGVGSIRSGIIYSDGTNMGISNQQNGSLTLYTNNSPQITMLPSGNVGIGTTTPQTKLDVVGSANISNILNVTNSLSTNNINMTLGQVIGLSTINGIAWPPVDDALWSKNGDNIYNDNTGNVGIGTTTPTEKLSVLSTIIIKGPENGASRLILGSSPGTNNYDYCSLIQSINNFSTDYSSDLRLYTHGSQSNSGMPTEHMRIDGLGSVSIFSTLSPPVSVNNPVLTVQQLPGAYSVLSEGYNHAYMIKDINNTVNMLMGVDTANGSGYIQAVVPYVSKTSLVLNPQLGNVGINNTNPQYALDVSGDCYISSGLTLNGTVPSGYGALKIVSSIENAIFIQDGTGTSPSNYNGYLVGISNLFASNQSTFVIGRVDGTYDQPNKALYLTQSGNVGIGITNPQATLSVNGTLSTVSIIDNNGASGASGQVLTTGAGGQVIWGSSAAPLQSGTAQFNGTGTIVQQLITTSYTLTSNSIIQLSWYNDNNPLCQNPIYTISGSDYVKQVWWNLSGSSTQFQIEIGPKAADVGYYHLIKWALLSL